MNELLSPQEEYVLYLIQNTWLGKEHGNAPKHKKLSISEIRDIAKNDGFEWSHEWTRQLVSSLHNKGEILIDVKGRERLCRPNHVTINSRSQPESIRNFTIIDKQSNMPTSRIWASIYKGGDGRYAIISESKRDGGKWKTTSNIILQADVIDDFLNLAKFIRKEIKG